MQSITVIKVLPSPVKTFPILPISLEANKKITAIIWVSLGSNPSKSLTPDIIKGNILFKILFFYKIFKYFISNNFLLLS